MPTPITAAPLAAPLADELAALRAEIARLSAREMALRAALDSLPAAPPMMPRPGWPIRRIGTADLAFPGARH